MRTIKLTGKLSDGQTTEVDDRFYNDLDDFAWVAVFKNGKWYVQRGVVIDGHATSVLMHREVWKLTGRAMPRQIIHIDGNGLNNQLANLRAVPDPAGGSREGLLHRARINLDLGLFLDEFSAAWMKAVVRRAIRGTPNNLRDRRTHRIPVTDDRRNTHALATRLRKLT